MEKKAYNEAVKEGGRLKDSGRIREAIKLLKTLSEEQPQWPAAFLVLAHIFWEERRLKEARESFTSAIEISPKLEIASLGRFHTLWESEHFDEAIEEANRFQAISDSQDYRDILNEIVD